MPSFFVNLLTLLGMTGSNIGFGNEPVAPVIPRTGSFRTNNVELQVVSGALFSPPLAPSLDRPTFNYAFSAVRIGWMFNSPNRSGRLWINVQLLSSLFSGVVIRGAGSGMVGVDALVRFNFVKPGWWLVPFVQAGAGILYNDVHRDPIQRLMGQALEFIPQASTGARFMLSSRFAVTGEFVYHHISNAKLASRNTGVNALGALLGVSFFYGRTD